MVYVQSKSGFSLSSEFTPIEISDFLKAGLSFSESPRYIILPWKSDFSNSSETTKSNASPLFTLVTYTSMKG